MSNTLFATPEEAEQEFYRAFEQRNLEAMRRVWSEAQYIECIHPMGPRLHGPQAVIESWREIFEDATPLHFEIQPHNHIQSAQLAIHSVAEKIHTGSGTEHSVVMLATNIYELTSSGWRMILHHASPARGGEAPAGSAKGDATLH